MDMQYLKFEIDTLPNKRNLQLLRSLLEKRDAYIDQQLKKDIHPDDFLYNIGMYALPIKERSFLCEEEKALFHGASIMDLAIAQDVTKIRMKKQLKQMGIVNPEDVIKEGERFRRLQKVAKLKVLLTEGVSIEEAAKLVEVSEHLSNSTRQSLAQDGVLSNNEKPLAYKNADRREKIYEYYSEGMTQQEIADKMKLSRGTINADLKCYLKEHPECKDKTILWRQRNTQEPVRENRRNRKADVIFLREIGLSPSKIVQITKVNEAAVYRYLDEEGMLGEYISPRRALVQDLVNQGLSDNLIAKKLGYNVDVIRKDIADLQKLNEKYGTRKISPETMALRAEEMKLSWQGMPTTGIVEVMGKSRVSVLRDQHLTSNFLRNNSEALAYVTEKNGDVTEDLEIAN